GGVSAPRCRPCAATRTAGSPPRNPSTSRRTRPRLDRRRVTRNPCGPTARSATAWTGTPPRRRRRPNSSRSGADEMASLPPLVTLADFGTWVGEDLTGDQQAAMILDAASALVRAEARRTWTDDSGNLVDVPEQVRTIT